MQALKNKMIQRIQTVYLLVVAFFALGLTFIVNLWKQNDATVFVFDLLSYKDYLLKVVPVLFLVVAVLAIVSILMFSNRKLQFVLNRFNILTNLILLGILLYYLLSLSGEMNISEKGIGVFIPIVNVFLLVLANKAIQKDENLVKSVDRLR